MVRMLQVILAQKEITEWRMVEVLSRSASEYSSIVGSATLITFGSITAAAGTSVPVGSIWTLAAVQVQSL